MLSLNRSSTFIIHARKAWLKGLSPKENRDVPPLRYDIVQRIKKAHPHLNIILNGGIKTLEDISEHLLHFDGVMIGREAYHNPWILSEIENNIFDTETPSREDIVHAMQDYTNLLVSENNIHSHSITRHMMGLFKAQRGGKIWRQSLSVPSDSKNILLDALEQTIQS